MPKALPRSACRRAISALTARRSFIRKQIEPCNAAFSPTDEEVAMARKMIAAFELPENRDKGVVQIDGRMVERLHADMAQRTVAIADAIAKTKEKQPA